MRLKLFAAILFFPFTSFASFDFNPLCRKAYNEIINLRLDKGRLLVAEEKKNNPGNRIPVLLENYCDFLTLVITEERPEYDALQKNKSARLAEIESGDPGSPWFLYCKAEINLQWAFAEVKFGDNMSAAIDISKAYRQLEANEKKFPGFLPAKKCMGLLHALIGNIPDNYKWAVDIIGMSGTVKQGIAELQEALNASALQNDFSFLQTESLFYLSFIELNLDNDESGQEKIFARFTEDKLNNPLLLYAAAGMALHTGRSARAQKLLEQPLDKEALPFHYLVYLKGVAMMNKLDTNAASCFRKYISDFKGINFIRSAYRNLAWCRLISGDKKGYLDYMERVMTKGSDMTDEDKQALKEAKSGEIPEINLLRSRLLFDGGYYKEALDEALRAEPSSFISVRDLIEFEYRLARIHHKMGDTQKAIDYYKMAVRSGEKYPYYFAANSALQLGLIYETLKDKQDAAYWFKKCLAMKNHEYQDSIELKAKAGLSRVEE